MTNDEMKKALEEAGYMVFEPKAACDLKEIERLAYRPYDPMESYEVRRLLVRVFPFLYNSLR